MYRAQFVSGLLFLNPERSLGNENNGGRLVVVQETKSSGTSRTCGFAGGLRTLPLRAKLTPP